MVSLPLETSARPLPAPPARTSAAESPCSPSLPPPPDRRSAPAVPVRWSPLLVPRWLAATALAHRKARSRIAREAARLNSGRAYALCDAPDIGSRGPVGEAYRHAQEGLRRVMGRGARRRLCARRRAGGQGRHGGGGLAI